MSGGAGELLRSKRAEIISRWLSAIRECAPASRLSPDELTDHLPGVFDRLTEAVDAIAANAWGRIPRGAAERHAVERLGEGFDLGSVLTELFLLRHILHELIRLERSDVSVRERELSSVNWAIDVTIRETVEGYDAARQRPLEQARERAEAAARSRDEALALLESVYATAPVGLAFFDRDLRFVRVSEALARMDGLSPETHAGRRASELMPAFPQISELEAEWRRAIETGKGKVEVEVSGATPAAPHEERTWTASWNPVRVGDEIVGVGVVAWDVTRKRQEADFQRHIIGIASHDLRTPITAIKLSAEALLAREGLSERQRTTIRRVQTSTARLESIVGGLLDVTRLRAGQGLVLERQAVDLELLCRQVLDEAQTAHPTHRFVAEHAADARGEWDGGRLAQVISNLVTNAVAHTEAEAPITLRCTGDEQTVTVEVENQGQPIPPELLPHIFEPFRRGGGGKGLGLGLYIAREIVHAHAGALTVDSEGSRTVFRIRLPRSV